MMYVELVIIYACCHSPFNMLYYNACKIYDLRVVLVQNRS